MAQGYFPWFKTVVAEYFEQKRNREMVYASPVMKGTKDWSYRFPENGGEPMTPAGPSKEFAQSRQPIEMKEKW